MPNVRACLVSFTDSQGIEHTADVAAGSLFEAAALAVAEFKQCGLMDAQPGPATRLSVIVKAPTTRHDMTVAKLQSWLAANGKSPSEQALKSGLRQMLEKRTPP